MKPITMTRGYLWYNNHEFFCVKGVDDWDKPNDIGGRKNIRFGSFEHLLDVKTVAVVPY